jgi:hypothetical protein
MYSVLNCYNIAKHTEFYLGYLQFSMTFTGNAVRLKNIFTVVFQMLQLGDCYKNVCNLKAYKLSNVHAVEEPMLLDFGSPGDIRL